MAKKVAPLTPEPGREVAWVWFKHEDDNIGPAGFTYTDQLLANGKVDPKTLWRSFDPNRQPDPWYRLGDVRARARALGLEVVES